MVACRVLVMAELLISTQIENSLGKKKGWLSLAMGKEAVESG